MTPRPPQLVGIGWPSIHRAAFRLRLPHS
jgi:hypothetical protein